MCTRVSQPLMLRDFLIFQMSWIWKMHDLHVADTWASSDRFLSKITPMLQTVADGENIKKTEIAKESKDGETVWWGDHLYLSLITSLRSLWMRKEGQPFSRRTEIMIGWFTNTCQSLGTLHVMETMLNFEWRKKNEVVCFLKVNKNQEKGC